MRGTLSKVQYQDCQKNGLKSRFDQFRLPSHVLNGNESASGPENGRKWTKPKLLQFFHNSCGQPQGDGRRSFEASSQALLHYTNKTSPTSLRTGRNQNGDLSLCKSWKSKIPTSGDGLAMVNKTWSCSLQMLTGSGATGHGWRHSSSPNKSTLVWWWMWVSCHVCLWELLTDGGWVSMSGCGKASLHQKMFFFPYKHHWLP